MEENKNHYEAVLKSATTRVASLQKDLAQKEEKLKKQELLMEEMYKLIYYKRAWLTLSDDNIRGMQEVVGKIPPGDGGYPHVMPRTSDEHDDNDPWGV